MATLSDGYIEEAGNLRINRIDNCPAAPNDAGLAHVFAATDSEADQAESNQDDGGRFRGGRYHIAIPHGPR